MENTIMETRLYLAYGANLNQEDMAVRCPDARVLGPVTVQGYELLFRGARDCAFATIEPNEGGAVPCLLWQITPRCEKSLDYFESYPRFYRKETLTVEHAGGSVEAMVYIMNEGALGAPSESYLSTIREGYRAAGLDMTALDAAVALCRGESVNPTV